MSGAAPIRERLTDAAGILTRVWTLWVQRLVQTPGGVDIEITDSAKGVILTSANGDRWRVTVDNAGTLVVTAL